MKQVKIGDSGVSAPAVVQGCMRIDSMTVPELEKLVYQDLENGVSFFDHADCYSDGKCEELFGELLKLHPDLRDQIILQTKCGILTGELYYFDFSKAHLLETVDNSLKRLHTDHVDFLLLHRPDALMEPEEVAAAFDDLASSGKVLHFGVSNQNPGQMELLRKYVKQPLEVNQLQFSVMHTGMVDAGFCVNTGFDGSVDHDGGILDYCRLHDCTIQAWSPFQYGFFDGVFLENPKFPKLNEKIHEIAKNHGVSGTTIAIAWILRHPAGMQAIVGSTNLGRLKDAAKAGDVVLSRKEWYEIYHAAGNMIP